MQADRDAPEPTGKFSEFIIYKMKEEAAYLISVGEGQSQATVILEEGTVLTLSPWSGFS